MIWAILVGNTRVVSALMKGERIVRRHVVPTDSLAKISAVQVWAKHLHQIMRTNGVIVASVVPSLDRMIQKAIRATFALDVFFVTPRGDLGVGIQVKKPHQVGADRLANAAAVRKIFGAPSSVVDYGTGTTFDVVDVNGAYCGGAILPGIGISLRALHEFTAKLPLVPFRPASFHVGRTTEEAIRSGIYHGAVGTTRELLAGIRKELGQKAPAVATGGWSVFFKGSKLFQRIEPDLTLLGLFHIWNDRHA